MLHTMAKTMLTEHLLCGATAVNKRGNIPQEAGITLRETVDNNYVLIYVTQVSSVQLLGRV